MTQEALKKMYQLLLTEPHAPTVCAQLERIAREALAEHAMRETQRLGQEIEQKPVAWQWLGSAHFRKKLPKNADITAWNPLYTTPPQRKPLTDKDILADETLRYYFGQNGGAGPVSKQGRRVVDAIEAAHDIKEDT